MRVNLRARLVSVHPLPGVRAGSALVRVDDRLLAVQDDAFCAAWVTLPELVVSSVPLAADGAPLAKPDKPDFEAALRAPDGGVHLLGSGSLATRCTLARLDPGRGTVSLREAGDVYDSVSRALGLVGRPNIEGAGVAGDRLRLFHRGAAAQPSGSVDLPLGVLDGETPEVLDCRQFDLGSVDGVPLAFTDATVVDHTRTVFLAAAENTVDAIADGAIAGSAVGLIAYSGDRPAVHWTRLLDPDGRPSLRKVEGLALDDDLRGGWLLTDPDDAQRPAELCRVALEGFD
ncbi:DUF6929 family protein [Rhodococcus kronopolitis]|uniref:DUF6929 family protein n=1 Tax=Rhodococcus kronopolitis TaxID=1460226 RepID=A0ABV9FS40_9NOCA